MISPKDRLRNVRTDAHTPVYWYRLVGKAKFVLKKLTLLGRQFRRLFNDAATTVQILLSPTADKATQYLRWRMVKTEISGVVPHYVSGGTENSQGSPQLWHVVPHQHVTAVLCRHVTLPVHLFEIKLWQRWGYGGLPRDTKFNGGKINFRQGRCSHSTALSSGKGRLKRNEAFGSGEGTKIRSGARR